MQTRTKLSYLHSRYSKAICYVGHRFAPVKQSKAYRKAVDLIGRAAARVVAKYPALASVVGYGDCHGDDVLEPFQAGLNLPLAGATKQQFDRMVALNLGHLDKSGVAELTFKGRHA